MPNTERDFLSSRKNTMRVIRNCGLRDIKDTKASWSIKKEFVIQTQSGDISTGVIGRLTSKERE
jgi:hypothetical protein